MGCVQSYFRKAHNAGLSPSSTVGSEKGGIPQDVTVDVADLVDRPEKEPLDINDIQNEDEVIQTEKQNENATEPNGTVKTDDNNVTKVIAATGTAAVIGALASAAVATADSNQAKEEHGQVVTQINKLNQSPKPADIEAATEVPEVAKTSQTEDYDDDDAVIIEATEIEENESASTPVPEESAGTEAVAQQTEKTPSESVPEDRPSTAKSDESKEQGSRPESASDVVIQGKDENSRPMSAMYEGDEGTRTSSASVTKEKSVPDQNEEADSGPQSGDASGYLSSTEQETQSQKDSRPVSVAQSLKETSRPESTTAAEVLVENSQTESRPSSSKEKVNRPYSVVEEQVFSESIPENNAEPAEDEGSRAVVEVESIKEQGSRPESSAAETDIPEESAENQTNVAVDEEMPVSVAENFEVKEEPSEIRSMSASNYSNKVDFIQVNAVESNKQEETKGPVESQVADVSDTTEQETRAASANENAEVFEDETERERKTCTAESINKEDSRPPSMAEDAQLSESRPVSKAVSIKGDSPPADVTENVVDIEENSESRPVSTVSSAKEQGSPSTSAIVDNEIINEECTSRPVSVTGSTKEENSRPANVVLDTVTTEEQDSSRPVSTEESTKEEEIRSTSTVQNFEQSGIRPESVAESTKEEKRPGSALAERVEEAEEKSTDRSISIANSTKGEGSRPASSIIDSTEIHEEQKDSRPVFVAESTKEESRPSSPLFDIADINEEQEKSRPVSVAEPIKEESLDAAETVEQQISSRPVSVSESTKDGGSRPASAVIEKSEEPDSSRPVSVAESIKEAKNPLAIENIGTSESLEQSSRPESIAETNKDAESRPASIAESTKDAESRPASIAESTKDAESRPASIAESTKDAENRPDSIAESTKDYGSRPVSAAIDTTGVTEQETISRPVSVAESTKEEGNRPDSTVINTTAVIEQTSSRAPSVTGSIKEDGSRPSSTVVEATQEHGSRPTSVVEENDVSEEKATSLPVSVSESNIEEENGPTSTIVDTAENVNESLESAADSTKDETSRPPSSAVENEILTEVGDRHTSVAELTTEDEDGVDSSKALENNKDAIQEAGSLPVSSTDINEEVVSIPVSVIAPDEPVKTEEVKESQEARSNEIKQSTVVQIEQIPPELPLKETSSSQASSVEAGEHEEKQSSRPSSSVQVIVEDGRSATEAGNEKAESATQPAEAETEISEISDDGKKLEDEEPTATLEDTAEPESSQILSGSVPSLTVTEVPDEPRSDDEIETQTEDETKPTQESASEKPANADDKEILNSAATTIQATFRGFQTRQALNKVADVSKVQQTTSHDFLFGPPVDEAAPSVPQPEPEPPVDQSSVTSTPRSPETGEKQLDLDKELVELQKPQECDDLPPPPEDVDIDPDADSSVSTAATKIQAGVRGFLTRRQMQHMKNSNSTIGDSMPSLGDTLTSQEEEEDDGVQTSGSLDTEVQKQHQVTIEDDEVIPQDQTAEVNEIPKGRSLDSQLNETTPKSTPVRSAVSFHDGPVNEEEDRQVWQSLQQDVLDNAATKIQSNFRGYRTRRSLKREDAVQIRTTSTSTATASTEVVSEPIRHSGEFHDMMVLPPSPQEDSSDASTSVSGPIQ